MCQKEKKLKSSSPVFFCRILKNLYMYTKNYLKILVHQYYFRTDCITVMEWSITKYQTIVYRPTVRCLHRTLIRRRTALNQLYFFQPIEIEFHKIIQSEILYLQRSHKIGTVIRAYLLSIFLLLLTIVLALAPQKTYYLENVLSINPKKGTKVLQKNVKNVFKQARRKINSAF